MMVKEICPTCGFDKIEIETVRHIVRGGNNAALLEIEAEACQKCGEKLFTGEQVEYFDEIRNKLKNEDTSKFKQIGKYFHVK